MILYEPGAPHKPTVPSAFERWLEARPLVNSTRNFIKCVSSWWVIRAVVIMKYVNKEIDTPSVIARMDNRPMNLRDRSAPWALGRGRASGALSRLQTEEPRGRERTGGCGSLLPLAACACAVVGPDASRAFENVSKQCPRVGLE